MFSIKLRNNKASDIKLVSLYSTIKMMHVPINIRYFMYFPWHPVEAALSILTLVLLLKTIGFLGMYILKNVFGSSVYQTLYY